MSDVPKLGLTTARQAVVSVLAGAAISWLIMLGFEAFGAQPPVVPWTVPGLLIGLAVAVTIYARALPKRIEDHRVSSQEAFAALAVGKSMIVTGAVFAGGHVVYVMFFITRLGAPLPAARVVQGAATVVAALLLAGAGALLERACVAKGDDGDDEGRKKGQQPEARGHPDPA